MTAGNPLSVSPESHQTQNEDLYNPITQFQQYLRIKIAYPDPDYSAAVSFLKSQVSSISNLHSLTLYLTPDKPILLLTWTGSNPSLPSILLNSHIDSVPAEPEKWLHPPFSALRTPDGKIFARGAQDDKCIGVQSLEAIRNLRERDDFTPVRTVHVVYVPDEEFSRRCRHFDVVKRGWAANSEVISVNAVYSKAEIPSPSPSEAEAGFDVRLPPTADPDLLKKRIAEEWVLASRNMTYQIIEKGPIRDYMGRHSAIDDCC
ncbi:hypothetical protein Dimus_022088 [Dionaea muscipula]